MVTNASLIGLSWLNLLVSDMQTAFGAFVSVHLTASGWNPGQIGAVLSAGGLAAMVAQVPAGMLVDGTSAKRGVAGAAIVALMLMLLVLAAAPGFHLVLAAEIVAGCAGAALGLAITAITLSLSTEERLGERLGKNVRSAAIGAATGAAVLGLLGSWVSTATVFVAAASLGLPALWALCSIHRDDILAASRRTRHHTAAPPSARRTRPQSVRRLLADLRFLALMVCAFAFFLSNAAQLPLAATDAARHAERLADLLTGAATVVPQLMVAVLSPWVGRQAQSRGRRVMLLIGFCALPLRALLFAIDGTPALLLAAQSLDGVSAAVYGVVLPLVVADITHRGGRFNLALSLVGVAGGLGAAASNAGAGVIADLAGLKLAFLCLAAAGALGALFVWLVLPETVGLPADGARDDAVSTATPGT